ARPVVLAGRTDPAPVADRLIVALRKAYATKPITVEQHFAPDAYVWCEERDLMELLGNLIENAFKYCKSRVDVGAIASADGATVRVTIDDDGPGVPAHQRVQVLARGARGDTATDGHGIGLAVAAELAASYGGGLAIETSGLGGARVVVDLPAAGKTE
ncbi:MAG TPA: ATP-binding protein, partial [Pseudomonadales bacterium]